MVTKTILRLFFLPFTIITAILEKGFLYWILYSISFLYISLVERFLKRRTDTYDLRADGQPEKNGYYVPDKEWCVDTPQKDNFVLNQNADDVFFFGVNSQSDSIAVHISRQPNSQVRRSLLLRLSDGREYSLPEEHAYQQESGEDYTFGSSRLKLQCVIPMRKWRVFFNGLLKEQLSNGKYPETKYKHVTFTFIFTSSSDIYDFTYDRSKSVLAHNAATSAGWQSFPGPFLRRMNKVLDGYEQSGMLLGTVKIEGQDEKELYLWGNRGHYTGETRTLKSGSFSEVYGSFENGAVIHLGFLTSKGLTAKYQYGYIMRSDGFIHPIEVISTKTNGVIEENMRFSFVCGGMDYGFEVIKKQSEGRNFGKEFGPAMIYFADMTLGNFKGKGFIINGTIAEPCKNQISFSVKHHHPRNESPLSILFEEARCQNSELTGGKGSSLGKLYSVSKKLNKNQKLLFVVPQGLVVTTEAFKVFARGPLHEKLQAFQKAVWSKAPGESKELCQKMVEEVTRTKLPEEICTSIRDSLRDLFSVQLKSKKFAVRSSATGEDTEQMSAAGQMETFLGLKYMDQIFEAVRKCWASQFAFQAVEYKRRYGQLLNTPMAVVIQEMVPCEVAGVAFTCDPVTGNPSYISITANWGLGESVVSASAEPDSILLERDLKNHVKFHSREVGKKQSKIVMDGHQGTKEVEVESEQSSNCCLSNEEAMKLGEIAVKIEGEYGSSRDLEWGILDGKIFLFQSRPVTSVDVETDFEAKHFFDCYLRRENEYFSTANLGEVMPGATSPLGLDVWCKILDSSYERQDVRWDGGTLPYPPYYQKRLISAYNHVVICLCDGFLRMESETKDLNDALMYSLFGRTLEEDELAEMAKERHTSCGKVTDAAWKYRFYGTLYQYIAGFLIKRTSRWLEAYKMDEGLQYSPMHILNSIGKHLHVGGITMTSHMKCSLSSSNWNSDVMLFLSQVNGEWNSNVYSDFAYLLSTSTNVLSAEVPAIMQKLGHLIAKSVSPEEFKKMSEEEALQWLQTSNTEAGLQFREFLQKHGHRCLKEFDVMSSTWEDDPKPLIKMIQNFVDPNLQEVETKKTPSFSTVLSKLNTQFGFIDRLKLRWLLPNCRRGVREREVSKSVLIKSIDKFRKLSRCLADVMIEDGYLPNRELLYFLCVEEIRQLIRTRSPRIVARALKRKKFHKELDDLFFAEIFSGIPKPVNSSDFQIEDMSNGLTMTGVPVSQGVVKGTARVIQNLAEATNIKAGDILITYATDIGWSPYFPFLSGIVTELGGLISHGAVVAREYGLPCVVGLHGATAVFKSGDLVILDGNKGTLKRVERSDANNLAGRES